MVKYRAIGPKQACITDGKIYDLTPDGDGFRFLDDEGDERYTLLPASSHCERFELIQDGPVRTVQRIIPGTYDGVVVGESESGKVRVSLKYGVHSAEDLTRAAAVLTALAGALRDGE